MGYPGYVARYTHGEKWVFGPVPTVKGYLEPKKLKKLLIFVNSPAGLMILYTHGEIPVFQ